MTWLAALLATVTGLLAALLPLFERGPDKPKLAPIDYGSLLLVMVLLVAISVLAVGVIAARAGIRRRERRRDAVERLLMADPEDGRENFTEEARKSYVEAVEQFSRDLVDQGRLVARREAADVVSQRHVRRGAELLSMGSTSRRGRHLGSIGGVILGTGLAQWVAMLADAKFSALGVSASLLTALIGVTLVVYQWVRD
jgi:hypothetical protein